ncbi:hypothetical protein [Spirillospora sp. CA-294931]|uniref:hypothetical protein n=1 Tax=Spirillospora sp. CA-294931 TaxID=3240042 RepID=UPI003D918871
MTVHRIALDPPVPEIHAAELAGRVFFVSEAILDFALVRSADMVEAVDVVLRDALDLDQLARKLRFVVANDVLDQKPLARKVIWRGDTASGQPGDVYAELLRRGMASETGEGQIAVGEPVLSLMDGLDAAITTLAADEFETREYRYPTLIPVETMRRCGYFRSFPQLMMFVSRLHGDVDTYRGFLDAMADGGDVADGLRAHCDHYDYCLPPTMCFHTYHQLADRPLGDPSLVVTSRGKSFRFESRYRRSLERLWDFTIREIVFLGSREFVLEARRRLMERSFALVDSLGLGGLCEVANDPFFIEPGTAERVWSQHLLESKYELRLPLDDARDVAVGSFNFHERFFGESFGIETPEGPVYTACAGFGLERFAYAFLCRHGLDPGRWPSEARKALAS